MTSISNIPDWHRYVLGVLVALATVCAAVASGALVLPPALAQLAPWAGLGVVFLTAFLPRIQTQTGVNAPPILSPQDPSKPARPAVPPGASP